MISLTLPRIRVKYARLYSRESVIKNQIHTNISENDDLNQFYLRFEENEEQKSIFLRWTDDLLKINAKERMSLIYKQYNKLWHSRNYGSRFFDLHGREFQNFAISLTNQMEQSEWRQLSVSRSHADHRILHGRVYATGSRDDIGWHEKFLDSPDERTKKKLEMVQHLQSPQLFDWFSPNCEHQSDSIGACHELEVRVTRQGTQETVQELLRNMQNEPKLIGWLDVGATHNVCGNYSIDFGGAQEEKVATNCDGTVLFGTTGQLVEQGLKPWVYGR